MVRVIVEGFAGDPDDPLQWKQTPQVIAVRSGSVIGRDGTSVSVFDPPDQSQAALGPKADERLLAFSVRGAELCCSSVFPRRVMRPNFNPSGTPVNLAEISCDLDVTRRCRRPNH